MFTAVSLQVINATPLHTIIAPLTLQLCKLSPENSMEENEDRRERCINPIPESYLDSIARSLKNMNNSTHTNLKKKKRKNSAYALGNFNTR